MMPLDVREYIKRLNEVESIKRREPGGDVMRQAGAWWSSIDESMRCYLLSTLAGDDWERYMGVRWLAIPDGLRGVISQRARSIERQLRGCPWR